MSNEPDLHQIINALSNMEKRHQEELTRVREDYVAKLRQIQASADRTERDTPVVAEVAEEPKCSICGHEEERHTSQLPEEGGKEYCTECEWQTEFHAFDGSEPQPDDKCVCMHRRDSHQDHLGTGGAQCTVCPGDEERSWRHEFVMKTDEG